MAALQVVLQVPTVPTVEATLLHLLVLELEAPPMHMVVQLGAMTNHHLIPASRILGASSSNSLCRHSSLNSKATAVMELVEETNNMVNRVSSLLLLSYVYFFFIQSMADLNKVS